MSLFRLISSFTKQEIQTLLKTARTKVSFDGITVKIAPKQSEYGRILVITPKKCGNAPQRNLLRRRFKAIFFEEKLYERPYDCVVFAISSEALGISFATLKELLTKAILNENH